ncbi:hemerythrin domain-containing protein [Gordonia sp. NPDC003424]
MTTSVTTHKTMNTVVHAAFRRDLARFDDALSQPDASSPDRARHLTRAWDYLTDELHKHHSYEEDVFWPTLQTLGADLSLVQDLDGEHVAMRAALRDASTRMDEFASAPTSESAERARVAIGHLADVLLEHLAHEEHDLEPISAHYNDTPEMRRAVKTVIKKHRGHLGQLVAWLQDGASENERRGLRQEIPAPVVFVLNATGGRRYRREIGSVWAG